MKRIILLTTLALVETVLVAGQPPEAEPVPSGAGAAVSAPGGTTRSTRNKSTTPPAAVTVSPNSFGGGISGYGTTSSSRGDSIPPVMIRFSQADPKASTALEKDLFIMARVIGRTLEKAEVDKRVPTKMGVAMALTGSGRSVRPMYIEGLGPLFMIKVNFPVMPPPKADEKPVANATQDSEWEQATLDLYGNEQVVWPEEHSGRISPYNEEQVELLKKELIDALKNAANIHGLKPEEFVSIAVFGHSSSTTYSVAVPSEGESNGVKYSVNARGYLKVADSAAKGTVMTLRAKKGDIDAFASGKLTADAFKSKVAVTTYYGSGASSTSINSWIQESAGRLWLR